MQTAPAALPERHPLPHWIPRYSSTVQGHSYDPFASIYSYRKAFEFDFIKTVPMHVRFPLSYTLLKSVKAEMPFHVK